MTISGNTIPVADVTIRQPNGTFVGSSTVSGPNDFHDTMTLPVTGTYTITVDPRDVDTGQLTFRLDTVPDNTGTTAIGQSTDITIGTIGENAVRSFAATAGQKITMTISGNTIPVADVTIRQPNGTFVGSSTVSGPNNFHDTMTLPVTGTYTITVDPRDRAPASSPSSLDGRAERRTRPTRPAREVSQAFLARPEAWGPSTALGRGDLRRPRPAQPGPDAEVAEVLANDRPGPAERVRPDA